MSLDGDRHRGRRYRRGPTRIVMRAAASPSDGPAEDEASPVIDVEITNEDGQKNDNNASSQQPQQPPPQQPPPPSGPAPALFQIALTGATALWSGWTAILAVAPTAALQIAFNPSNVDLSGHTSGLFLAAGLSAQVALLFRAMRNAASVPGRLASPPFKLLAMSLVGCATAAGAVPAEISLDPCARALERGTARFQIS